MRTRRIRFASGTNRWARDLYLRAFPEDERIPWALIHVLSLRRGVDLVGAGREPRWRVGLRADQADHPGGDPPVLLDEQRGAGRGGPPAGPPHRRRTSPRGR